MSEEQDSGSTMILVHPGSMCGSARSLIGRMDADAAREEVLQEIEMHEGGLIVIDGFLSDELSAAENTIIVEALERNRRNGRLALRVWGCDAGEAPPAEWTPFGLADREAIFDGQEEAAAELSCLIDTPQVEITGAWARDDLKSGCATSVLLALREQIGDRADIMMSPCALREPDDTPDDLEP